MKKNKEKTLGIRVNTEEMVMLDNFCEINNTTRSKVVRTAISTYVKLNLVNHKNPNLKMVISQNILKPLIELADNETIEKIAEISKNNSFSDGQVIFRDYKDVDFGKTRKEAMTWVVNSIVNNELRPDASNWFEKIRYSWDGDNLIIVGKHNLGKNFSRFIKYYFVNTLKDYKYELVKEDFQNSKPNGDNGEEQVKELMVLTFSPKKK